MTDTRITGASDDLVELDGAIYDEYDGYDVDHWLRFDTGAVVVLRYDRDGDGIWRIEDHRPRAGIVTIVRCEDRPGYTGTDGPIYADEATVAGATSVQHTTIRRGARP